MTARNIIAEVLDLLSMDEIRHDPGAAGDDILDALAAAGFAVVELPEPRYRPRRNLPSRPKVYDFGLASAQVFQDFSHWGEPPQIVVRDEEHDAGLVDSAGSATRVVAACCRRSRRGG